jgi:hypothetical protein
MVRLCDALKHFLVATSLICLLSSQINKSFLCACTQAFTFSHPKNLKNKNISWMGVLETWVFFNGPTQKNPAGFLGMYPGVRTLQPHLMHFLVQVPNAKLVAV